MTGIRRATPDHLKELSILFEQYRTEYGLPAEPKKSRKFLKERLRREDSVFFIVTSDGKPVGFAHLYNGYSLSELQSTIVLNDLYVLPEYRYKGFGAALLEEAQTHLLFEGAKKLVIQVPKTNDAAHGLFTRMGFEQDSAAVYYIWGNREL